MTQSQWISDFITPAFPVGQSPRDPAVYFRKTFQIQGKVQKATLYVTAIGLVESHLNGETVGDEVLAPGWTSYRNRLKVSVHDVTHLIQQGENALGAIVGEGWAVGRVGYDNRRNHYSDRPALYLQLELDYGNRTETVCTDHTFRCNTGPILENSLYDGEVYDARLDMPGWDQKGFDDRGWTGVETFEWPRESLFVGTFDPIRRTQHLSVQEVITTPSGKTVLDFGQNLSGWVRLTAQGERGTEITLRHAETLTHGEFDPTTLRSATSVDRFILKGDEVEVFEPRFTFHGFRYVQVEGYPGQVKGENFTAVVVHSDMRRTGWLETSNHKLNQLHQNVVWSMRGNFVGLPTDCPQRDERLGWTGDMNAFAPTATFLYDVRGVLGSWLEDLNVEHHQKGFVPWVVPDVLATPSPPTALWSDTAVSLPWRLYQQYGDLKVLQDNYSSMKKFILDVETRLDETGLWNRGFQFGDWLDPDAPMDNPMGGKTDRYLVASAYLCKTTREMAETARLLGHAEDHTHFEQLACRVHQAFLHEYITGAGRIVNESSTAYALAITFGLLNEQQQTRAGKQLAQLVQKAGHHISTGFAGTPLVVHALSQTGHLDDAYRLLLEETCPSFLYPLSQGATTVWERWDSIREDGTLNPSGMTSLNHFALGAVADWMHQNIGGLQLLAPGYQKIGIQPGIGGDLTFARLRHLTPHGEVQIHWELKEQTVTLEVQLPEGTEAEVVLPLHPDNQILQVTAGHHQWRYHLPETHGEKPEYTFDTPLKILAGDPDVWGRLTRVFEHHFPGYPIDGNSPEAGSMNIHLILNHIPGASQQLQDDLKNAITPTETEPA